MQGKRKWVGLNGLVLVRLTGCSGRDGFNGLVRVGSEMLNSGLENLNGLVMLYCLSL